MSKKVEDIFKESMDKLNSILLYLDHQLGTVSLTPEEVASLGGVKNTEEPSHTIVEGKKEKQKKEQKNKEKRKIMYLCIGECKKFMYHFFKIYTYIYTIRIIF